MKLYYKCQIIRNNPNERQLVTIESEYGATLSEIRIIQADKGWVVEKAQETTEQLIFNTLKNKGYEVFEVYIPTQGARSIDNFYGADVFRKHLFLGYTKGEVIGKLSKIEPTP